MGRELDKMGYTKVYVVLGGWKAWEAAGYPTVLKDVPEFREAEQQEPAKRMHP